MPAAVATILTVDDASFVRRWCAAVLGKAGHRVVEAAGGDEGIQLYKVHKPDVVLLDVLMPEKDGLAVLKELREHDPEARVVMLTTHGQLDTVREAEQLGARDFLVKPCGGDLLLSAVQRALA